MGPRGEASLIGLLHIVVVRETLQPGAFSVRWVDHVAAWLNAFAQAQCCRLCAGGKASRIGLVHNVMAYETLQPDAFSARWVDPVVIWLNRVWATPTTLDYFREGRFTWMSPWSPTMQVSMFIHCACL